MVNERITSSVTTSTDSSPDCVGSVVTEYFDVIEGKHTMDRGNSASGSLIGRNIDSSFNMLYNDSLHSHREVLLDRAQNEEQDPTNVVLFNDEGENHEVELKNVVGLFGGDEHVSTEEDDAFFNVKEDSSGSDRSGFDSSEKEGTRGKNRFIPRVKMNKKFKSFISSIDDDSIELSSEGISCSDQLGISKKEVQPREQYGTGDELSITKESGSNSHMLDPVDELQALQETDAGDDIEKVDVSHVYDDMVKEWNDAKFGTTKEDSFNAIESEVTKADAFSGDGVEGNDSNGDESHSLKVDPSRSADVTKFGSGDQKRSTRGVKKLISRVKLNPKLKSLLSTKASESKHGQAFAVSPQDIQRRNEELETSKVVSEDNGIDDEDDGDDECEVSKNDERSVRSLKTGLSGLDLSLFGRTRNNGSESKSVSVVEEQKEKPFECRQMKVTLQFKALAGISQVSSGRQLSCHDGDDNNDTVKAVVTYRRNTIASDRFVSTHVPSLPLFLEQTPDLENAQLAYAQWPGWQEKDDDSTASGLLMSSVTLTRTVRRARNFDKVSTGGSAGGSKIKEPNEKDGKRFLASLSQAFAPELLDVQVGLMRGSSEIIPLGIATVVIPGERKTRMQLDIPVVRNYCTGEHALNKKKRGVDISQFSGKAKSPNNHVYFSADKDTKYKINDGAFLRLELSIEPAVTAPAASLPARHLNTNTRKANFGRSGPINRAMRRRRKMDHLMSLKKLPLRQRAQLYLELRSRRGNTSNKAYHLNSQEVDITRQSEVSELSGEIRPSNVDEESDVDDATASSLIDQFEMLRWASDLDTVVEHSKSSDSHLTSEAGDTDTQSETFSLASRHERLSLASYQSNASADLSFQPKEAPASSVSVASFLAGRLSPTSQYSDHDDDLTYFSSSLHSVFITNHPQKHTVAQNLMDLVGCEPNLVLCEDERNALKYYAYEHEDERCAHYCGLPSLQEEFSIPDTFADEDTLNSLESRDPYVVDR